jgi:MioC protein
MAIELKILVGTMTGNAQTVAQEIELTVEDDWLHPQAVQMDGLDASVFQQDAVFLICSSTYGSGDVPDNARHLYDSLVNTRPDLSNVRYGVIALGDTTYMQTFCFGGKKFDTILGELGAQRIGDVCIHNASDGTLPEDVCVAWASEWVKLIEPVAA